MDDSLKMSVSPICVKDGKKIAYVEFSDGNRRAEGIIPDCVITSNKGFFDEEIDQLEQYMKNNLAMLKKMASGINAFSALKK